METLLFLELTQRIMDIRQNVVIAFAIDRRSNEIEPKFTVRQAAEDMPSQRGAKSILQAGFTEGQR
jgi:hypothetical protein